MHNACISFSTFLVYAKRNLNVQIRIISKAKAIQQFPFQRRERVEKHSTIFFSKREEALRHFLKMHQFESKAKVDHIINTFKGCLAAYG